MSATAIYELESLKPFHSGRQAIQNTFQSILDWRFIWALVLRHVFGIHSNHHMTGLGLANKLERIVHDGVNVRYEPYLGMIRIDLDGNEVSGGVRSVAVHVYVKDISAVTFDCEVDVQIVYAHEYSPRQESDMMRVQQIVSRLIYQATQRRIAWA